MNEHKYTFEFIRDEDDEPIEYVIYEDWLVKKGVSHWYIVHSEHPAYPNTVWLEYSAFGPHVRDPRFREHVLDGAYQTKKQAQLAMGYLLSKNPNLTEWKSKRI